MGLGGRRRFQVEYTVSLIGLAPEQATTSRAQVNYTQGALRYIFMTAELELRLSDGTTMAYGVLSDAVYGGIASQVLAAYTQPVSN